MKDKNQIIVNASFMRLFYEIIISLKLLGVNKPDLNEFIEEYEKKFIKKGD